MRNTMNMFQIIYLTSFKACVKVVDREKARVKLSISHMLYLRAFLVPCVCKGISYFGIESQEFENLLIYSNLIHCLP